MEKIVRDFREAQEVSSMWQTAQDFTSDQNFFRC
jgi:hypothetical protein